MLDVEELIQSCREAVAEPEPLLAVRDVLERAVADPAAVEAALPAERSGIVPLHASDEVSILHVVWAPGMRFRAHDHRMWAAIAMYGGQEDNTFYRQVAPGGGIEESGGRSLRVGDVALLGDDTIHAVANPLRSYAGAIHVYGGPITTVPGRREWDEDTGEQVPYDFERTQRYFDSFNS